MTFPLWQGRVQYVEGGPSSDSESGDSDNDEDDDDNKVGDIEEWGKKILKDANNAASTSNGSAKKGRVVKRKRNVEIEYEEEPEEDTRLKVR